MAQHPTVESLEFSELTLALSEAVERDELQRLSIAQNERSSRALSSHLKASEKLSRGVRELRLAESAESSNIDSLAAHRVAVIDARAEASRTALAYSASIYRERVIAAVLQGRERLAAELIEGFEEEIESSRRLLLIAAQS